ncbi:MAG: PilZ domain-containing protein [Gammaproteobacteria bacterium]|nr:PilZ domain-containing protein [Gammaproteobacteria bacterium]
MTVPKLKERRLEHRYPIQLPIDLVLEDGTILSVEACNISTLGLQFKCDSLIANEIEPRGIQKRPLDQIKLKVVAKLPVSGDKKLYSRCKIVVARRLSQDQYILGLEFIDFEANSDKVLDRYIEKCRQQPVK